MTRRTLISTAAIGVALLTVGAAGSLQAASRLRIMPMGDSITWGGSGGGYRLPLYNQLVAGGYDFDFVGRKSAANDITPDTNHWGAAGWQISYTGVPGGDVINGRSYVSLEGAPRPGIYNEMDDAISRTYFSTNSGVRNVILLMIGMNDFLHQVVDSAYGVQGGDVDANAMGEAQDKIAEGCIDRLQGLLSKIDALAASQGLNLDVTVATINQMTLGWKGDPVSEVLTNEVTQYNQWIRASLPSASYGRLNVKVVEMEGPLVGKLADGVHPNTDGYNTMAQVWYAAMTNSIPPPGKAFVFSSMTHTKGESGGTATITVKRINGSAGAASVQYATSNGSAAAGSDYVSASGTLTWADGDASDKTFPVAILNDAVDEADETVTISLENPSNAALGTPNTLTLTILDDDTSSSVTIVSSETWDGKANPHAAQGVTLTGGGTVANPYVYTVTNGMSILSSGRINCSPNTNDCSIRINIRGGNLSIEQGGMIDISRPNRGNSTLQTFTLDLDRMNSITGAGTITAGITVGTTPNQYPRALIITNVNHVALADIDVHVVNANDTMPRLNRPVVITANGAVVVGGSVNNSDTDTGGNGASDVTICASAVAVSNVYATANRAYKPNGYITLKALSPSGGYVTNSLQNLLTNRLVITGTIQNNGIANSTPGNVTLQGVVVQFKPGFQLLKQSGTTFLLNAAIVSNGYSADQLFINNSGSTFVATHNVQWSAGTVDIGNQVAYSSVTGVDTRSFMLRWGTLLTLNSSLPQGTILSVQ